MVGPRRLGPLGGWQDKKIRGAEEGAASRQGVEASGLGNPTVKMDRKRWFPSHTPVISKGEA